MKVGAIVQARMGSTRLPGKVLRDVEGTPLLGYVLERLQRCASLDALVVATSYDATDDAVSAFCRSVSTACHRGPAEDVAERMRAAAAEHGLDALVRVNGDSPLLDPALVDRGVALLLDGYEIVTNVFPRSFPPGQSVEALRMASFERGCAAMTDPADREHVTTFFYRHPESFAIRNFTAERDYGSLTLAVDTEEDIERLAEIVRKMTKPQWEYGLDEVAALA